jgi:cytochrome P450
VPDEAADVFSSMIAMDDPKHFRMRSIVAKGFGPREVGRVEDQVKARAAKLVDHMLLEFPERTCDFVKQIAAPLPLQIICGMMGVPEADEPLIRRWTDTMISLGDPDSTMGYNDVINGSAELFMYSQALGEDRRANPRDDITSVIMAAEVDGERLDAIEFASFFILLVLAGSETTRNAISHGMKLLTDNPDQKKIWFDDFDTHSRTAVEEIVRVASPVIHFRRTALQDTEINGQKILEGEKLVMFYASGNRDERMFTDPHRFDVTRETTPAQIGFGAGGIHFCLGANLARREISVMFNEIARRVPTLRTEGEPVYMQSSFLNGIMRLQCSW